MTNKIKFMVTVNGKTVKTGFAHVDNRNLAKFERELMSTIKRGPKDNVEVLFR